MRFVKYAAVAMLLATTTITCSAKPEPGDEANRKPSKGEDAANTEQAKQAVVLLVDSSKAGDLQSALDQIAQPFHDLMLVFILTEEADDILRAALDQKFGSERRVGFRMEVKQDLLRIQKVDILDTHSLSNTKVKLTVRETLRSFSHEGSDVAHVHYLAVREGERWKLLRPFTAMIFGAKQERIVEKGPDGKEVRVFKISFDKELDELGEELQRKMEKRLANASLANELKRLQRHKDLAEKVAADVKAGKFQTRKEAVEAFDKGKREVDKQATP